jgi:hypothetical protein
VLLQRLLTSGPAPDGPESPGGRDGPDDTGVQAPDLLARSTGAEAAG